MVEQVSGPTLTAQEKRLATYIAAYFPKVTPRVIASDVRTIFTLSDRLHRLFETACNRVLHTTEKVQIAKLESAARNIARQYNLSLVINGDPRGAALKIAGTRLPGDMGGDFPCCE